MTEFWEKNKKRLAAVVAFIAAVLLCLGFMCVVTIKAIVEKQCPFWNITE